MPETTRRAAELEASEGIDLATWIEHWWACARYSGERVPELEARIETLLLLWRTPIDGGWERAGDAQLLGPRYRRGDAAAPHSGEHAIEAAVLAPPLEAVSCISGTVIDGVNAVPLALDRAGGRAGNVEADLFLLVEGGSNLSVLVVEVKTLANNAWYAAIQNLLQLRLTKESHSARSLFQQRHAHACFTHPDGAALSALPHTGIVLAPSTFYCQPGKKANAVAPTAGPADALRRRGRRHGCACHLERRRARNRRTRARRLRRHPRPLGRSLSRCRIAGGWVVLQPE
jgi:hypothetical protein